MKPDAACAASHSRTYRSARPARSAICSEVIQPCSVIALYRPSRSPSAISGADATAPNSPTMRAMKSCTFCSSYCTCHLREEGRIDMTKRASADACVSSTSPMPSIGTENTDERQSTDDGGRSDGVYDPRTSPCLHPYTGTSDEFKQAVQTQPSRQTRSGIDVGIPLRAAQVLARVRGNRQCGGHHHLAISVAAARARFRGAQLGHGRRTGGASAGRAERHGGARVAL